MRLEAGNSISVLCGQLVPVLVTLVIASSTIPNALAQSNEPGQSTAGGEPGGAFRSPVDIPNRIEEDSDPRESRAPPLLGEDFLQRWTAFKADIREKTGFAFSLAYAYVLQHGSSSSTSLTGSSGQFEFNFTWDVIGRDGMGQRGYFGGKLENRHRVFSDTAAQSVAPMAGAVWTGALGYGEQDWSFPELWYEHHFVRDRFLVRVGKINPFAVFDFYKYKSPRTGFISQPQTFNPTIAYPPSALGIGAGARLTNGVYAAAGVFDANGVPTKAGFNTLFEDGELFTIADLGWAPDFVDGLEPGVDFTPNNDDVHLTFWHSDRRKAIMRPEGWGVTASVQKGFGKVVPFARYGYSNGGATPLKHLVNVGVGFDDVFGYAQDTIGIGLTWGDPSASNLRDQYAAEFFYRMQFTPYFALTPDIQLIAHPANDTSTDLLGLFSVRGRLAL